MTNCKHKNRKVTYCVTCYQKWKYHNNTTFRKAQKSRALAWHDKMQKKDPTLNAKRQKLYRKNNPDKFNFMMAKHYYRKLTAKQRKMLKKVK